jgi:Mg2+ and Co2+ transporter CorA
MTTRRTTMKSRTGTKLYAVRDRSGKFKDVQSYKRAHAADMRHISAAEVGARLDDVEKKVLRAKDSAVKVARSSMQEAIAAARAVRSSMKEAVAAVRRATKKVAKRVSTVTHTAKPVAKTAKRSGRKASQGLTL